MLKSELVKQLQKEIRIDGDSIIQNYSINCEMYFTKFTKLSPHRKDKKGNRAPMTNKEFRVYCDTYYQFEDLAGV